MTVKKLWNGENALLMVIQTNCVKELNSPRSTGGMFLSDGSFDGKPMVNGMTMTNGGDSLNNRLMTMVKA